MHRLILTTLIGLKTLTPTLHKPPSPPPSSSPPIFSVIFGNGLTSLLLVLVILLLLAIIVSVIWMFMKGRWITAQTPAGEQRLATLMTDRPLGPTYRENRAPTNQSGVPGSNYPSPPGQTAPPSSPTRDDRFQKEASNQLSTNPEDPLNNKRWFGLVKGCVDLYDELDGLFPKTDPRQETANHVKSRLQEILSRSGVETIARDSTYDIHRHQLEQPNTRTAPGTAIKEIVSPGFAVGRLVLRPARVRVATLPVENAENDR